jgi:hypothetical protein
MGKRGDSDRASGCEGKGSFESAALAHKVTKRRNRSRKRWDDRYEQQGVYRCPDCGKWHIGRIKT